MKKKSIATEHVTDSLIYFIRGKRVMLDSDLALIYGVETKVLNQAVKRNLQRFPEDFMFQLTENEFANLRSQIVTSSLKWGGNRYLPYVFTEHGAVMLASVLNSPIAVQSSIQVVKAFVRLREILSAHRELAEKLDQLEKKYDRQFAGVFEAIRQLMKKPENSPMRRVGFRRSDEENESLSSKRRIKMLQ